MVLDGIEVSRLVCFDFEVMRLEQHNQMFNTSTIN